MHPRQSSTEDPTEIVRMDQESAEDDVYIFLDNEDTEWDIKVTQLGPVRYA